jgi:alpha-1,6-mannosyltransferase
MAYPLSVADGLLRPAHSRASLSIGRDPLPTPLRRDATLGVLDITEWFGETSGGIRTYLMQKAQYVAAHPELRHVVTVPGERDSVSDERGVRMYRLQGPRIPRQRPYRFMLATRSVSRIVQHERPDVIEIGSPFVVPWIVRHATAAMHVPLVCFYHTNVPRLLSGNTRGAGRTRRAISQATWHYMRKLERLFQVTIVSSAYSARELAAEGITRIATVPLGVEVKRFRPLRRAHAADTRARFGLPAGLLAGFVGRFAREKELRTVLDGWPEIERRTGARLVLIGAGPVEAELRAHPYSSRVVFLPFQSDRDVLADLMAALDVYVAPSRIETFGLAALEALSSGTPVLSADDGGVADLVKASGAGRVFVAGNVESLVAEAVALFLSELELLGRLGRDYAKAEHCWETVFDRLFAVYANVVAAHRAR